MRYGLLHGRFQPWHQGHLGVAQQAFSESDYLCIGIVNPEGVSLPCIRCDMKDEAAEEVMEAWSLKNNPYSYWERYVIVKKTLERSDMDLKKIIIAPHYPPFIFKENIMDYYLPSIAKSLKYVTLKSAIDYMKIDVYGGIGFNIKKMEPIRDPEGNVISGTSIRNGKTEYGFKYKKLINDFYKKKRVYLLAKYPDEELINIIARFLDKNLELIIGLLAPEVDFEQQMFNCSVGKSYFKRVFEIWNALSDLNQDFSNINVFPLIFNHKGMSKYNKNIFIERFNKSIINKFITSQTNLLLLDGGIK